MWLSTGVGTTITSRAVHTVKLEAADAYSDVCIVSSEIMYYAVVVCQLSHSVTEAWKSPDFKKCSWADSTGPVHAFAYAHNEFVWKAGALSEFGETTCDGIVVPKTLVMT